MPISRDGQIQKHWERLARPADAAAWRQVVDEFTGDPALFQGRKYSEFVTFLPYVQRFLYGEGKVRGSASGESPIRVFRRTDVARARLTYPDAKDCVVLDVAHVDLHLHKAALVMFSDRLVEALNRPDIQDAESVKRFKRNIRRLKEIFLRFNHRYWFHARCPTRRRRRRSTGCARTRSAWSACSPRCARRSRT